jgi:hypothetical protein
MIIGVSKPEIDAILEDFRKTTIEEDKNYSEESADFLNQFKKGLSSKSVETGAVASPPTGNGCIYICIYRYIFIYMYIYVYIYVY